LSFFREKKKTSSAKKKDERVALRLERNIPVSCWSIEGGKKKKGRAPEKNVGTGIPGAPEGK